MEIKWIFNAASFFNKLCNTEILSYVPRFDWVFSRDYLPKTIKGNLHVINLDKYVDVGTHWYCFILKKKWNCLFR